MSRNLVIVKADGDFRSFNAAAEDEHLVSLGARDAVVAAVDAAFPNLEWSDGGSATHEGLRFEVGIDDPVEDLVATLDDDVHLPAVLAMVTANGWHATDSGMGEFIDLE
jgi:hypothetical protein